jgi:CRP-like cAMP-binding protein
MQREDVAKIVKNACKVLTPAEATEIAAATVPVGVPAGNFVCKQGDRSDGLLIFVRGSVEIARKAPDGAERVLATVSAPTVLGEMGLVTDRPRSASVKATTACEFHVLTKKDFKRMLDDEQLAAFKLVGLLAEIMARRLEAADDRLLAMAAEAQKAAAPEPAAPAPAPAPAPDGATPAPSAAPAAARVADLDALREKLFSEWSF